MDHLLFPEKSPVTSAVSLVLQRLSVNWKVTQQRPRVYLRRRWSPDLILRFRGPQSAQWRIIIASGVEIAPEGVAKIAEQMYGCAQQLGGNVIALVTAPFLSRSVREHLVMEDLSYADSTGNLRINGHHPQLLIEGIGADVSPQI